MPLTQACFLSCLSSASSGSSAVSAALFRGSRLNLLSAGPSVYVILMGMVVAMLVHFHRHHIEPPVTDLALGHQLVGELAHLGSGAAQDDGLQAIIVVEVHVHRRQDQLMVFVLKIGEPLGQVAGVMVVNI